MMIQNTQVSTIVGHSSQVPLGEEVFAPKPVKPSPLKLVPQSHFAGIGAASAAKRSLSSQLLSSEAPNPTTPTGKQLQIVRREHSTGLQCDASSSVVMSPNATMEMEANLEIQQILQKSAFPTPAAAATVAVTAPPPAPAVAVESLPAVQNELEMRQKDGEEFFSFEMEGFTRVPSVYRFDNDDDDDSFSPCSEEYLEMTPPVRADNPIYLDARFYNDFHYATNHHHMAPNDHEGAELGLIFNFSPPRLCSSH